MKKTHLNIDPTLNTWKQRLTVIISTLFGMTYHMTITEKTLREINENLKKDNQ